MKSLYFDVIDNELILELVPNGTMLPSISVSSKIKQFLEKHNSKIELALTGYFVGRGQDPKEMIAYTKESVKRYLDQGATAITVFLD